VELGLVCPFVTAAMLLLLSGCGGGTQSVLIGSHDPRIRWTGRFDARAQTEVRFAWPGSQFEAQFTGSSLRTRLVDVPVEDDTRETDWITVVIDRNPPKTFALAEGLHVYPLARGLAAGSHHALIWKRTEAEVGIISFRGFELETGGTLNRLPPPPRRRMEFVGDSIVAGYGNEGADGTCHWSATRENNYSTYGAFAARELGATYTAVAWSGKGVTRNYEARDLLTLPDVYDRVIPTEEGGPEVTRPAPVDDVVVVNLGTNDFFRGVPDEALFVTRYDTFLTKLRERQPGALFVLALGPMLADDYPQPQARTTLRKWLNTIQAKRHAEGDDKLAFIEFWIDPAEGVACDFHPNTRTHERMGHELAALVRSLLGW
jgi:lysophospholipase L1-like esterase